MPVSQNIVGQLFPTVVLYDAFGNPTPVPSLGQQAVDLLNDLLIETRRGNALMRLLLINLAGTDAVNDDLDEMIET